MSDDARIARKTAPSRLVQWSDDDRALAFELYYTDAGRNLVTLASIISTYPYDRPIPYRTLYDWRQTQHWDIEADKRADAFAPNRRRRTSYHLTIAAERFAAYLAQVASGAEQPDKLMIAAAKVAFDASGFAATRAEVSPAPKQIEASDTILEMTPEAASERIRLRRESWNDT
jgi:hypothetical protein